MTVRIKCDGPTASDTVVTDNETGEELTSISGIKISPLAPATPIYAEIDLTVHGLDVEAHPLLGDETLMRTLAAKDLEAVVKGTGSRLAALEMVLQCARVVSDDWDNAQAQTDLAAALRICDRTVDEV